MSSAIVGNKRNLPIHAKRSHDKTFDRIWKYYYLTDKQVKLSDKEEEIRRRWEFAWMMDLTLLSRFKMSKRICSKFKVSQRTAYEDIKMSRMVFSDPTQQNKEAKRSILNNILETSLRKARARGDDMAVERLAHRYSKINGLDFKEADPIEDIMKNQKPSVIIFSADPETLKKQAESLVEDIDHEELDESKA
jgi:hypothetical protein